MSLLVDALILVILISFVCLGRKAGAPDALRRVDSSSFPTPPSAGQLRPLADWAFDYGRMLLESTALGARERDHALHSLQRLIVPLIGHVRLCDIDDELLLGARRVVACQLDDPEGAYVSSLCVHFVSWARRQSIPKEV